MDSAKYAALAALKSVVDPEIGLDLVTLGLIYRLDATPAAIRVAMTLTTRGCPLGDSIVALAQEALEGVSGERAVAVTLVWEPAWNPAMISAEGREALRL